MNDDDDTTTYVPIDDLTWSSASATLADIHGIAVYNDPPTPRPWIGRPLRTAANITYRLAAYLFQAGNAVEQAGGHLERLGTQPPAYLKTVVDKIDPGTITVKLHTSGIFTQEHPDEPA